MNYSTRYQCNSLNGRYHQQGAAVLAMTLVILAVLTIIGITSSKTASIETRMTSNAIEKHKSRIAAESALNYALAQVKTFDINGTDFLDTCGRDGIYDLRASASPTCPANDPTDPTATVPAKNLAAWNNITHAQNWGWTTSSLHGTMLDKLSADNSPILVDTAARTNPMRLVENPQYAIGIHDPILQPGSEGQYCFPVSIIAAAKGGVNQSQTLLMIKAIPENGCFYP